jgi:hypothetical protein
MTLAAASEGVDDALRQVPVADFGEQQDGEWSVVGGLQYHGVARGQRGGDLETGDHQR